MVRFTIFQHLQTAKFIILRTKRTLPSKRGRPLGQATPQHKNSMQFRRSATRTTSDLKASERQQLNLRKTNLLKLMTKIQRLNPPALCISLNSAKSLGHHTVGFRKSTQKRHQHGEQEDSHSACTRSHSPAICQHRW